MILKHFQTRKPQLVTKHQPNCDNIQPETRTSGKKENKNQTNNNVMMTTAEKVEMAQAILDTPSVKKIKKDKGLIERAETNKTILTEDNKELLID